MQLLSRRTMIRNCGVMGAACLLSSSSGKASGASAPARYRIGACDWSIGKQGDVSGLALARRIGLDGLQVSLGTAADHMKLRQREVQQAYLHAAAEQRIRISSLAIGELNNVPYKSDPRTEEWVSDSIDVCQALGCSVVLLAFFGKGDVKNDPAGTAEVIRRLKRVTPKAEKAGVKLGFESWLSAEEHMKIIEAVGSPALQVYYDVCNSTDMGYDIYREIRWLGRQHICEFHMKENGSLLGQGKVDFRRVREAMDEIGYEGWMQIEGAVPSGKPMLESYQANCAFLRRVFA